MSVLENIRFFANLRNIPFSKIKSLTDKLLKSLCLQDKKDCLVESLSRGMQQKTALICTLITETPIIFLDEPTLGLDIESINQLKQFFTASEFINNKLILITSHNLGFVRDVATKQLFMKDGRIYDIDLKNINNNIYKIKIDGNNDLLAKYEILSKMRKDDNCIYVDISQIKLSEIIGILEQENIYVTDMIKMNNDIENIYLDFIKNVDYDVNG
jgi:ABC-2 type transport system ATP-binding protein